MTPLGDGPGPPTLLGITIRRSLTSGRVYLLAGTGLSMFYAVVLGIVPGSAFESIFPVLLPVLAVVGGLGAMNVFTSDRIKGVFEYLIAYGVPPQRVFANVLVAGVVLESIVVGSTCSVGLAVYFGTGHPLTTVLAVTLLVYGVPMSFASVAFASMVGMFWTSLSSPRQGINSPIGLVPLVGIAPSVATLVAAESVRPLGDTAVVLVTTASILVVVGVVLVMLRFAARLLPQERLLSPA